MLLVIVVGVSFFENSGIGGAIKKKRRKNVGVFQYQ